MSTQEESIAAATAPAAAGEFQIGGPKVPLATRDFTVTPAQLINFRQESFRQGIVFSLPIIDPVSNNQKGTANGKGIAVDYVYINATQTLTINIDKESFVDKLKYTPERIMDIIAGYLPQGA